MTSPPNSVITDAVTQAFRGMCVGDSVAMPVHWYYDVSAIKCDYGDWISKYETPKDKHPSFGIGGSKDDDLAKVVGTDILHGKRSAWTSGDPSKNHYHLGMNAGDNTLNVQCALQVMKTMKSLSNNSSDEDTLKQIFHDYVKFMTTPDSHNDTFAEYWHLSLFSDWADSGKPTEANELYKFLTERSDRLLSLPANPSYIAIGGLALPTPIILHNIYRPLDEVVNLALEFVRRTHPVAEMQKPVRQYVELLHAVVRGSPLQDEAKQVLLDFLGDRKNLVSDFDQKYASATDKLTAVQDVGKKFGLACNTNGSFPIVVNIARCFSDDFEKGILMNVNTGGENCHRGGPLGALLGAASGATGRFIPLNWLDGLNLNGQINELLIACK